MRLNRFARSLLAGAVLALPMACTTLETDTAAEAPPVMRWDHTPYAPVWTASAMNALTTHGAVLPAMVPADVETWCPGYPTASLEERRAFWAGFLSSLAKYESTWRPDASGGGGRWLGLLQIAPATARSYGCKADEAAELKDGALNLSCAVRIMSRTVARDGVISQGMRGVAADWGPFHSASKRQDMAAWTRSQSYCRADA